MQRAARKAALHSTGSAASDLLEQVSPVAPAGGIAGVQMAPATPVAAAGVAADVEAVVAAAGGVGGFSPGDDGGEEDGGGATPTGFGKGLEAFFGQRAPSPLTTPRGDGGGRGRGGFGGFGEDAADSPQPQRGVGDDAGGSGDEGPASASTPDARGRVVRLMPPSTTRH